MELTEALRTQARSCHTLGSRMYGELLDALAQDAESAGIVRRVMHEYRDRPGPDAVALRLLGSIHRLVLRGEAPTLEPFYPTAGGSWQREAGVAAVLDYLSAEPERVRAWLRHAPQTNETGRSATLIGGLLALPSDLRLPVRLFEIGSSAGLNLLADSYRYADAQGRSFGPADSPVSFVGAWRGTPLAPWHDLEFRERTGSDIHPIAAATDQGTLSLLAYVWPDQTDRVARLRGALSVAVRTPPDVVQVDAADFVGQLTLAPGTVTVLWHSVMWQYLSATAQQSIRQSLARLGRRATRDAPLVHLRFEPSRRTPDAVHEMLISATVWPDAPPLVAGASVVLGSASPHGIPAVWESVYAT